MLKEIVDEIGALWAFWSTIIFIISFLSFWSGLEPPTPENVFDYNMQIISFLLADAIMSTVVGALIGAVTKPIIEFLKDIGLW